MHVELFVRGFFHKNPSQEHSNIENRVELQSSNLTTSHALKHKLRKHIRIYNNKNGKIKAKKKKMEKKGKRNFRTNTSNTKLAKLKDVL